MIYLLGTFKRILKISNHYTTWNYNKFLEIDHILKMFKILEQNVQAYNFYFVDKGMKSVD